jgi:hypothetical protein
MLGPNSLVQSAKGDMSDTSQILSLYANSRDCRKRIDPVKVDTVVVIPMTPSIILRFRCSFLATDLSQVGQTRVRPMSLTPFTA